MVSAMKTTIDLQKEMSKPLPIIDGETYEEWNAKKMARDYAALPLTLWIEESAVGDSEPFVFKTLNEASAAYMAFLTKNDLGGREAGRCVIRKGFDRRAEVVAHVSFNGRVWAGEARNWTPKTELLFESRK